jgi:hypothetical protein
MTDHVLYTTWLCSEDSGGGGSSAPQTPLTASVATLAVTADVVAPEVAIPVVAIGLAVVGGIQDHWDDITAALDRFTTWAWNVFESRSPNDLPSRGRPSSSAVKDDGKGNGQIRVYGPDGRAVVDYDFGHDHGHGDPHAHDWDWTGPKGVRGPGRLLGPRE